MPMDETMAEIPRWADELMAPLKSIDMPTHEYNVILATLIKLGKLDAEELMTAILYAINQSTD